MALLISSRGTKTQCIAAVNAIPANPNGNANNQLQRAKSSMITEINACAGPLVSVDGSGDFTASYSQIDISVQTIPGIVGPAEIASTPVDTL
jgi:hypothetical protein